MIDSDFSPQKCRQVLIILPSDQSRTYHRQLEKRGHIYHLGLNLNRFMKFTILGVPHLFWQPERLRPQRHQIKESSSSLRPLAAHFLDRLAKL